MSVIPVVRHLIACKKEPTMEGGDPSVHKILHAVRPKEPFTYPVWMSSFYLFAMLTDGQGICDFVVELRLARYDEDHGEEELLISRSKKWHADLGSDPLHVRSLSFMLAPVLLPETGVYRLYLICDGLEIGSETFMHGEPWTRKMESLKRVRLRPLWIASGSTLGSWPPHFSTWRTLPLSSLKRVIRRLLSGSI